MNMNQQQRPIYKPYIYHHLLSKLLVKSLAILSFLSCYPVFFSFSRHIWNYLRVVLSCMERMDLVELSTKENVVEIAKALNLELL
jgi:hypothetical protein